MHYHCLPRWCSNWLWLHLSIHTMYVMQTDLKNVQIQRKKSMCCRLNKDTTTYILKKQGCLPLESYRRRSKCNRPSPARRAFSLGRRRRRNSVPSLAFLLDLLFSSFSSNCSCSMPFVLKIPPREIGIEMMTAIKGSTTFFHIFTY